MNLCDFGIHKWIEVETEINIYRKMSEIFEQYVNQLDDHAKKLAMQKITYNNIWGLSNECGTIRNNRVCIKCGKCSNLIDEHLKAFEKRVLKYMDRLKTKAMAEKMYKDNCNG